MPHRSWSLLKVAGLIFAISWLPILLYIPYDALRGGGGNPIGLGLLMVFGSFAGSILVLLDFGIRLLRRVRSREGRAA
jgi:hypothetical protein